MTLNVTWLFVLDGAGLRISEMQTISRVYRDWSEKEIISSEQQLCGRKCPVDVRSEWVDWFEVIERQQ